MKIKRESESVVIVDIDGTIAQMNDREWYEYDKVNTDTVDAKLLSLLEDWVELGDRYDIFFISGRRAECRNITIEWLKKNVPCFKEENLYMRKLGDMRHDYVVKKEIFESLFNIEDIYLVFEDRDSVVEMWRDLGLTCYQVAKGDF